MDATSSHADYVRSAERKRVSALIAADMEVLRAIHADDFQLVTPLGVVLRRSSTSEPLALVTFTTLPWNSTLRSMFGSMRTCR